MKTNGYASASPHWNMTCERTSTGLTKREHFAAMAMQGMLANGFYDYQEKEEMSKRVSENNA